MTLTIPKRRWTSLIGATLLALAQILHAHSAGFPDGPRPVGEFLEAIQEIVSMAPPRIESGDRSVLPELEQSAVFMNNLMKSEGITDSGRIYFLSLRGDVHSRLAEARLAFRAGLYVEPAEAAIADYMEVYKARDWARWNLVADAVFSASIAYRDLLDNQAKARELTKTCADLGHAGCLNNLAHAYAHGAPGIDVDLKEAIRLHKKVVDTGTTYLCAGAFSAVAIAEILVTGEVEDDGATWLSWMQRAYAFLDQLKVEQKTDAICDRGDINLREYILWLKAGEKKPQILQLALRGVNKDTTRATSSYLLGYSDLPSFIERLASDPVLDNRCTALFRAKEVASLENDAAAEAEITKALADVPNNACGVATEESASSSN